MNRMLIASYNREALGDVLITIVAQDTLQQDTTQKGDIVRIFDPEHNQTLGYNFFGISESLPQLSKPGQVKVQADMVQILNQLLSKAGFEPELELDDTPKFVVGYVKKMSAHPNSDHLQVTEVVVDHDSTLQIVCGAPNIDAGQKVVVAKIGAMMPNGAIIWPGALRGVESDGMICAARELALPNAPQKRGILVLDDASQTGAPFDFQAASHLFVN